MRSAIIKDGMARPDVCIAGAGIIGLTLALALSRRGLSVVIVSAGAAMDEASIAAAGMLAVGDPSNPPELLELSRFSRSLYPALLESLKAFSPALAFQTHRTLQSLPEGSFASRRLSAEQLRALLPELAPAKLSFLELEEASLDPRQLAEALIAAIRASAVVLRTSTRVLSVLETQAQVTVETEHGSIAAAQFVDCTGAWSLSSAHASSLRVIPRKGQMLTVSTPASLASGLVLRTEEIYLVPRLHGPARDLTVLGATVEDAGFDRSVQPEQLAHLLSRAAQLLPSLATAQILSSWAGFRPATADLLPVLGAIPGTGRLFIASGHYRNGILLAPGTAELMTQLLLGETPVITLQAFSAQRFTHRPGAENAL